MSEAAATAAPARRPSLLEIATIFAGLSVTSFGGGQKAGIRRQVCSAHQWMSEDEFMEGLEFSQIMPGPNILNLAVFCGQRVRGVPGAAVAFFASTIPAFVIILIAGALYFTFAKNPYVHAALRGCAVGALGLTIGNAIELSVDLRKDWLNFLFLAATAVAVSRFHVHLVVALAIFGGLSMWRYRSRQERTA